MVLIQIEGLLSGVCEVRFRRCVTIKHVMIWLKINRIEWLFYQFEQCCFIYFRGHFKVPRGDALCPLTIVFCFLEFKLRYLKNLKELFSPGYSRDFLGVPQTERNIIDQIALIGSVFNWKIKSIDHWICRNHPLKIDRTEREI